MLPAPPGGQPYYLNNSTTAEGLYFHNGFNWARSWNMPWGIIDAVTTTTQTTNIKQTDVGIGLLSSSYAYPAARNVKITVSLMLGQFTGTANTASISLYNGTTQVYSLPNQVVGASDIVAYSATMVAAISGTKQFAVKASIGGTSTMYAGDGTVRQTLIIEDIGPAAAPA